MINNISNIQLSFIYFILNFFIRNLRKLVFDPSKGFNEFLKISFIIIIYKVGVFILKLNKIIRQNNNFNTLKLNVINFIKNFDFKQFITLKLFLFLLPRILIIIMLIILNFKKIFVLTFCLIILFIIKLIFKIIKQIWDKEIYWYDFIIIFWYKLLKNSIQYLSILQKEFLNELDYWLEIPQIKTWLVK